MSHSQVYCLLGMIDRLLKMSRVREDCIMRSSATSLFEKGSQTFLFEGRVGTIQSLRRPLLAEAVPIASDNVCLSVP